MALRTGCGSAEEVWQSTAEEVRQSTALRMLQQAGCIATRLRGVVDLVAVLAPFFRAVARVADCLFWETLPEACPQVRAALVCDAGRKRHTPMLRVFTWCSMAASLASQTSTFTGHMDLPPVKQVPAPSQRMSWSVAPGDQVSLPTVHEALSDGVWLPFDE